MKHQIANTNKNFTIDQLSLAKKPKNFNLFSRLTAYLWAFKLLQTAVFVVVSKIIPNKIGDLVEAQAAALFEQGNQLPKIISKIRKQLTFTCNVTIDMWHMTCDMLQHN